MLQPSDDPLEQLTSGRSLLGHGWREVPSFEDLDEIDEYDEEEEVGASVGNPLITIAQSSLTALTPRLAD